MRSDLFSLNLRPFFKVSICSDGAASANENFKNLPSEKNAASLGRCRLFMRLKNSSSRLSMMHFQHNPRKNIFCFLCLKEYSQMMFCHFCSASDEKLMFSKLHRNASGAHFYFCKKCGIFSYASIDDLPHYKISFYISHGFEPLLINVRLAR